ncbi:MAG: type III secretion system chaperone [Chlamydiales bacterium]|nr:type III secretion system chaperone [Chlamydiales bacterium]
MFEGFLLELAKVLHFSTLRPDQNGACLIIMKEGKIPLLFELDEQLVPNKILLSTPVIEFPIERRTEIYEDCLKMNSTSEETVSVKPDEDIIYLHRRIAPEIQASELELVVNAFLKKVRIIKAHVEELLNKLPKRPQIPPSPSIQIFPYKA